MIRAKNSYFYDSWILYIMIYLFSIILDMHIRFVHWKKKYSYSIQDKITRDFWFWNYLKISSS